jgi:hypothetical protein
MQARALRHLLVMTVALTLAAAPTALGDDGGDAEPGDDVVVVAVIDNAFSPYHWDFLASRMPQQLDGDPATDLPLDEAPDRWLRGFPDPEEFASYEPLDLTLEEEVASRNINALYNSDLTEWGKIERSSRGEPHYYYAPGTKVIGMLDFSGGGIHPSSVGSGTPSHGTGSASVSVGNLYGTCPECLLVFLTHGGGDAEAAIDWAMSQPWIDAITNSYGYSLVYRDRFYSGSDTDLQREASERGQTIFFSAGNGQANTFTAPNTTLFSSQEGPDWIVTVGAISPQGNRYSGSGKPAKVAAPGLSYPAAGGPNVNGQAQFSGTSNATPVTAGYYSRALHRAREALGGPSRIQEDGIVARGEAIECGDEAPDCPLGAGELHAFELRTRLYHGAVPTDGGIQPSFLVENPVSASPREYDLLHEGHGSFWGRIDGDDQWAEEEERIFGPLAGTAEPLERPQDEIDWMVVDSYCRQSIWGTWSGGYWADGDALPGPDPAWPLRSALEAGCGELFPPV